MRRREFIAVLGSTAFVGPLAARAQQQSMPVIGLIDPTSRESWAPYLASFLGGLESAGFAEGRNVVIEYRWAEDRYDQLPALAQDLVRRNVRLIVATGITAATAVKGVSKTIPLVFHTGGDPIRFGLVESLNRPGGNATGVVSLGKQVLVKQLELLHELVPNAGAFGFLANPKNAVVELDTADAQAAASALGDKLIVFKASTENEIDDAIAAAVQRGVRALLMQVDPYLQARRDQLVALATRYRLPAVHYYRDYALAGGLMSYGANLRDAFRLLGEYTGRVLKGERPADLPVQQSVKLELVVNLKAARALGLEVPTSILLRADEVIE
jgi:putative ABC transport system substrate-binding protein